MKFFFFLTNNFNKNNEIFIGENFFFFFQNDGSCVAFDLTESDSLFKSTLPWPNMNDEVKLRTAAYDTSFKGFLEFDEKCDDHQWPIISIHAIGDDSARLKIIPNKIILGAEWVTLA